MISFLEAWLSLFACTLSALFYKALTSGYPSMGLLLILLAVEFVSLVLWAFYWIVLYPSYFTPFRHLATPSVRILLLVC
jgi:hypothetical protein